jgi:hypothetical protein
MHISQNKYQSNSVEYPAGLVGDMLDFKFAFEGSGFGEFVNAWIILEASRESLGMDLS